MSQSLAYTSTWAGSAATCENYAEILQSYGVQFKMVDYYLQHGEITNIQGWILHISVVRWQVAELIDHILPTLLRTEVPFKIVKDKDTARNVLDGNMGHTEIGKIVKIYPKDEELFIGICNELIKITGQFKGPQVPTDFNLGSVIYTRYGGFNPFLFSDGSGKQQKYIYDYAGQLIVDKKNIPFEMPERVDWPFSSIANLNIQRPKKILHQIYKPISLLKFDPKGNVIKSLYLKSILSVKKCVIKQGKKNMWSDETGRDMTDRLLWQKEVYELLSDTVKLPAVLDYFEEDGDGYLVMEYIHGISFLDHTYNLRKMCQDWNDQPKFAKAEVLEYCLEMISAISNIHKKGVIHRDITPVNFMIDKSNRLFLIDNELAYSPKLNRLEPPYEFGTAGFISPEQAAVEIPTFKEDIYALGATLLSVLTGLSPLSFNEQKTEDIRNKLHFFFNDEELCGTVANCLHSNPEMRPDLPQLQRVVHAYEMQIKKAKIDRHQTFPVSITPIESIYKVIQGAIDGLSIAPTLINKEIWHSRASSMGNLGHQKNEFSKAPGLSEGISGIIYLLARVSMAGYDIRSCKEMSQKSWDWVKSTYLEELPHIAPGLYGGAAGIAMALATAMEAKMLPANKENETLLERCLTLKSPGLDLATGSTGQGLAAIQCVPYLEINILKSLQKDILSNIIAGFQKGGYWIQVQDLLGKRKYAMSLAYGNTGIIWYLLKILESSPEKEIEQICIAALRALSRPVNRLKKNIRRNGLRNILLGDPQTWDGLNGAILVYLKAYQIFGNKIYKEAAVQLLGLYPAKIVHDNFYQEIGLAGIGELYLEAYLVLKDKIWYDRAGWISDFFVHTTKSVGEDYYWLGNNSLHATADFMTGNSGIIHFLLRYVQAGTPGYRLLNKT